ncbi:septation protein SepH [uncultured Corynebacterium sp.]|uniref:septation protein SepH n=1 Tax=uncultured Corynebacterium sp. TaxID=159447 RepID=UPI0025D5C161|nr:septation protein SepH [uncultured Corynebacterium sp.]
MREIFLAPSDSTDTSLVLRAEDGEEFFLEVTDELRAVLEPASDAATGPATDQTSTAPQDAEDADSTSAHAGHTDSSAAQPQRSTGLHTVMPAARETRGSTGQDSQAEPIHLRPNEIQARIRAGATTAEMAEELGVPESRIEPFAHPVLLERARIADVAKQAHPVREDGPATLTLWEILATAFAARGHSLSESTWDAYRHQGEPWILRITWKAGLSANEAEWTFKQTMSSPATVVARNSVAADLTDPDFVQPVRSLTSVGRGERYDEAIDGREGHDGTIDIDAARAGEPGVTDLGSYTSDASAPESPKSTDRFAEPTVLPAPGSAVSGQDAADADGAHDPSADAADSAASADQDTTTARGTAQDAEKDSAVDEDFLQNPDPERKPTKRRRKAVTPHWEDVLLGVRSSTKRPRE